MIHGWMVQCSLKNNLGKWRYWLVFEIIYFLKFYNFFRSSLFFIFNWNLVKKFNKSPWVQFTMGCLRFLAWLFRRHCTWFNWSDPSPNCNYLFFLNFRCTGIMNPQFIKFQLSPRPRLEHPFTTNKFVEIHYMTLVYKYFSL